MQRQVLIAMGFIGCTALIIQRATPLPEVPKKMMDTLCVSCHESAPDTQDESGSLRAERLRERLEKQFDRSLSLQAVESAMEQRDAILTRSIAVHVSSGDLQHDDTWTLSLREYPWLVQYAVQWQSLHVVVNQPEIERMLLAGKFPGSKRVQDVTVTNIQEGRDVFRGDVSGLAQNGYLYDTEATTAIANVLTAGTQTGVHLTLAYRDAVVTLDSAHATGSLKLLAEGKSNFYHSVENRIFNVHKALEEKVHNTLVPPNGVYSFVGTLDTPVTLEKGWKEALGLFGGGAAPTPGGGICQAATTVYRAALLAGFPMVEKRNHSLYVSYYETFGVGMDATIFPGFHDLRFRNNTGNWILIQSHIEGEDAYVSVYGVDDGRKVEMEGPYFVNTRPRPAVLRPLGYQEIGWVQRITFADGKVEERPFISTYAKPIAYRSLSEKYPVNVLTDYAEAPQFSVK